MIDQNTLRQRLKQKREQLKMTEAEASGRLGYTGNTFIHRIENGPTNINLKILGDLCRIYDLNPLQILSEGPADENGSVPNRDFFEKAHLRAGFESLDEESKKEIKKLLPTLRKIGNVQRKLGDLPISPDDFFEGRLVESRTVGAARQKGRNLAQQLRQHLKLGEAPIADILGLVWHKLRIPIAGAELGPHCWGAYSSDLFGNPLIIFSTNHAFKQRNVFTIAHELGHHLMHRNFSVVDIEGSSGNDIFEAEANSFAQELLVPFEHLTQIWEEFGFSEVPNFQPKHVVQMASYFRVSFLMMVWCLFHGQKINSKVRDSLIEFCKTRLEHEKEILGYNPSRFFECNLDLQMILEDIVRLGMRKKAIGTVVAAKLLDFPVDKVRELI